MEFLVINKLDLECILHVGHSNTKIKCNIMKKVRNNVRKLVNLGVVFILQSDRMNLELNFILYFFNIYVQTLISIKIPLYI